MSEDKQSENQHPYENWKAVTEADFVTLFIKTWFAFVSTLRELYPQARPYYEATGDSPFVQAYKTEFADKFYFLCPLTNGVEQSLHSTYKAGLKIISEKYPRFLVDDFYHINLSYADKIEEDFSSTGGYSGKLSLSIKCVSKEYVKIVLHCSDNKFLTKAGEDPVLVVKETQYKDILDSFIEELERNHRTVDEGELIEFFYEALFQVISNELMETLNEKQASLPEKGFLQIKQVYAVIQSFCRRAVDSMRNSCLDSAIGTEHKLLSQAPIADYLQSFGGLTSSDEQNAYLWFIGFVYRLRNALFHEIINPLDPAWQLVFKNAYLVLKQIVDANISRLKTVAQLVELAPLIYWDDFTKAPPPDIPIESNDGTEFLYDSVELDHYNQDGAKVSIFSTIICKGQRYHVKCNVKWNEGLKQHKVKNVQIERINQLQAAI